MPPWPDNTQRQPLPTAGNATLGEQYALGRAPPRVLFAEAVTYGATAVRKAVLSGHSVTAGPAGPGRHVLCAAGVTSNTAASSQGGSVRHACHRRHHSRLDLARCPERVLGALSVWRRVAPGRG